MTSSLSAGERKNGRMADVLRALADEGVGKVAVYGAGQHTWDVIRALHSSPVEIVGIIDDRARGRFAGWPIAGPDDAGKLGAEAIVLSSDTHEEKMWQRRAVFEDRGMRVIRLYAGRDKDTGDERDHRNASLHVAPGHYYSPIPCVDEIRSREREVFGNGHLPRSLAGIELNENEQIGLLEEFKAYYTELPFPARERAGNRYYFENEWYSYSDAIFLYCMIRHARPKRIIEVGSGFSSCAMLDVNDRFFDGRIACAFIDPNPERLLANITPRDVECAEVVSRPVQDLDAGFFSRLKENDILFVDSSHVTKTGGDVNHLIFQILPSLKRGVFVHFHDVFYPFEYPKEWVYEGRAWNEAYLLRAFLQNNQTFKIVLFNTFLQAFHEDFFRREMPLCLKNRGGSIWIQKIS